MSLADLIKKRPLRIATDTLAFPATHQAENPVTVAKIATVAVANSQDLGPEELLDTDMEARRQRVLTMLLDNPALRLAVVCDGVGDPVPVAVAIRDKGTAEILIPAARFDPFALLELVERHTMH